MRIEVIVDDKSRDRHEFMCQPRPGDVIQVGGDTLEVKELRHNLEVGRLQAWCSKRTPAATDKPLSGNPKNRQSQAD